jgi:Family of unknown function (DUF6174)
MKKPVVTAARYLKAILCQACPVVIALLLSACGGAEGGNSIIEPTPVAVPTPGPVAPPTEYLDAKQRWHTASIQDYRYTFSRACLCPADGPIAVTVRSGVVSNATYTLTGLPVEPTRLAWIPTLSGMFEKADQAYSQGAASVRITVNPTHGFLLSLDIDYTAQVSDEELHYAASNFIPDSPP